MTVRTSAPTTLSVDIPVLETERLILRAPRETDFDAAARFAASDRASFVGGPMDRWQAWRGFTSGIGHWILRGYGFWTVEHRDSGAVAGRIGLINADGWPEPELGWHVYDGFEGAGYAYEAAMAIRDFAWTHYGLGPLISLIAPENHRSRRLAERMGATVERDDYTLHGHPCLIYRHPKPEAAR